MILEMRLEGASLKLSMALWVLLFLTREEPEKPENVYLFEKKDSFPIYFLLLPMSMS